MNFHVTFHHLELDKLSHFEGIEDYDSEMRLNTLHWYITKTVVGDNICIKLMIEPDRGSRLLWEIEKGLKLVYMFKTTSKSDMIVETFQCSQNFLERELSFGIQSVRKLDFFILTQKKAVCVLCLLLLSSLTYFLSTETEDLLDLMARTKTKLLAATFS